VGIARITAARPQSGAHGLSAKCSLALRREVMAQLDMDCRISPRLSPWLMAASLGVIAVATLPAPSLVYPVRAQGPAPAHTNRLIDSANPYLLQHAHNPVDWYPWGPEAIAKAKAENKLIFLSIGYSTCYWCHLAERTVYADPAIAALMNAWFVNIKVDREERPDLDQVYMAARHLLTGSGGWPNNLFLTPDLEPISATGHVPAGRRIPGLKLDHPRQLALMHALVCFAHIAAGSTFTTAEIYPHVRIASRAAIQGRACDKPQDS